MYIPAHCFIAFQTNKKNKFVKASHFTAALQKILSSIKNSNLSESLDSLFIIEQPSRCVASHLVKRNNNSYQLYSWQS